MLKVIILLCFWSLTMPLPAQQKDSLITKTIVYNTSKAGEVYLLWAVNNWQMPESKYMPENSYTKEKLVYTKMERSNESFSLSLTLPLKTYVNFMFWIPVDNKGDSTDGWDTYGEIFYSSTFTDNLNQELSDQNLWMPASKKPFNILASAKLYLLIIVLSCGILFFFLRKRFGFSRINFFPGMLLGLVLLMILVRLQMNELFNNDAWKLPGAVFNDLLWVAIVSFFFYMLLYLTRRKRGLSIVISIIFGLTAFLFALFSIVNIQIVKQLGRPLNYQWLYYSDFMQGTDAKNSIAYNLSGSMITNIIILLLTLLILGIFSSLFPAKLIKRINFILLLTAGVFLIGGYVEKQLITYDERNIKNPVVELITSAYTANQKPQLFSMKIPDSTKHYINAYHSVKAESQPDSSSGINNIILFVMESTPAGLLGIYNTSITVTPNMKKWKNIATVYNNMYAHIPSTPNSMLSMIGGLYPLLSYRSLVKEATGDKLITLPRELHKKNWTSAFFSSGDLSFGNMEIFAKQSGFTTVEDSKTIACQYQKFQTTNSSLDGLNDKCIIGKYLQWADKNKTQPKFSMMWTNQTHYPYFFERDKEINYSSNKELNYYLNALKNSDEAFGELMEGLSKRGWLNNTLIMVVGDHGEAFGTHNQSGHASYVYEENMHVPGIMYNPLLCKGNTENKITGLIDIAPTILSIAGMKKPEQWQGRSLFTADSNNRAFFICPYSDFLFGTRTGTWKYIYNATSNKDELYDLLKDPKELNNVASRNKDIVKREYEMLGAWVQYHNKKIEWLTKELK